MARKKTAAPIAPEPDPIPSFGLVFPREWPEFNRRLFCARWNKGNLSQFEQRKAIIRMLWPPDVYEMNAWSLRRLRGFCENTVRMWTGPGGSGKSTDAAAIAVAYWLEAPWETRIQMCSTTKLMLRPRVWSQVVMLWQQLPEWINYKGTLVDSDYYIRWKEGDAKNGIFGFGVNEGPEQAAINDLVGIHTTRILTVLDEFQEVRKAIIGALPNFTKNPEPSLLGMGNPASKMSPLWRCLEPLGGWGSVVEMETEEWPIDTFGYPGTGIGQFFDGRKSPAYLDPEWAKRNPWMINRPQVDRDIAKYGINDPKVRTFTIGWAANMGMDNTVLSPELIEKFFCREPAIWTDGFQEKAALDPAFVEGGDQKILQFLKMGMVNDDLGKRWVIEFGEWFEVPIDATSEEPIEYQIAWFVIGQCRQRGIPPSSLALDSSGIGRGLKAIFEQEFGPVVGVEFGGAPSDLAVDDEQNTARDVFDRRSSELNIMVKNFANAHGIRGLSREAGDEFCSRLTEFKGKWIVEKKKDMKKRIGRSPDRADACCIGVDLCRQAGAVPGTRTAPVVKRSSQRTLNESDNYFSDGNYSEEQDWSEDQMMMEV